MKKILTILLVMMLALTACGKKSPEKVDEKKQEEKKDNEKKDNENKENPKSNVGEFVKEDSYIAWSKAVLVNEPKNGAIVGGDYNIFYDEGNKMVVLSAKSTKRVELSSIDENFVLGTDYKNSMVSLAVSLNTSISGNIKWEDAKFEDMEINGFKVKRFSGFKLHVSDTGKVSEGKDYFVSYFVNAPDDAGKEDRTYVLSVGVNEKSLDLKEDADKIADQVMQTLRKFERGKY